MFNVVLNEHLCFLLVGRRRQCNDPEHTRIYSLGYRLDRPALPGIWPFKHDNDVLGARLGQTAGSLSGGEQRMLALSRAFVTRPRIVLADELSLGLAPLVVDTIFAAMKQLADQGSALVIVEQYAQKVLAAADRAYLLTRGAVQWTGKASEVEAETVGTAYLSGEPDL